MNKKIVALCILGALLVSSAVYAQNYTGTGGRGMSLAILAPKPAGLAKDQDYLPSVVQGEFVSNFSSYSAISVRDRGETTDKVYAELLSGYYDDKDAAGLDLGHLTAPDYIMTGTITKTTVGYALQMQITKTADKTTAASYSGNWAFAELDNFIGIRRASLDLLQKMGVTLTPQARAELQQAAAQQTIQGQTALAQGIVAQRNGATIEAQMFYYQAAAVDPSLMEAANRASIVSASIRTGNIGQDMRNDLQWGRDWEARLVETERYFDNFFRTFNQPYALIYTPAPQTGTIDTINRRDETNWVRFTVELREMSNWTDPVLKTVNDVWQGLNATGRKTAWGFADWPRNRRSNVNPFTNGSKSLTIVVELLNEQQKVIGRQTFTEQGRWSFSFNQNVGIQSLTSSGEAAKAITFPAVKLADWTDRMTLRFTTVNNVPVADASKNGLLMITTRAAYRDAAGFNYEGGGYGWDGYDKAGYDKQGYARNGFNRGGFNKEGYDSGGYARDGFNKAGYDRNGFNRNGFNKEGYNSGGYGRDGFNKAGYDSGGYARDGYDKAGYDKQGYDRNGFDRGGFNKEGYMVDGSIYDKDGYARDGYDKGGRDREGFNKEGFNKEGFGRDGYNAKGFDKAGYDRNGYNAKGFNRQGYDGYGYNKRGYNGNGINRSGYKRWSPLSSYFEALYTFRPELPFGFTVGLLGAYGSFSYYEVMSDDNTRVEDRPLAEFVVGYTFNLLRKKSGRNWGLGLPLGVGHNNFGDQLVLETGLQLRFRQFEIRGTYRTIGFSDNSFALSVGPCIFPEMFQ